MAYFLCDSDSYVVLCFADATKKYNGMLSTLKKNLHNDVFSKNKKCDKTLKQVKLQCLIG